MSAIITDHAVMRYLERVEEMAYEDARARIRNRWECGFNTLLDTKSDGEERWWSVEEGSVSCVFVTKVTDGVLYIVTVLDDTKAVGVLRAARDRADELRRSADAYKAEAERLRAALVLIEGDPRQTGSGFFDPGLSASDRMKVVAAAAAHKEAARIAGRALRGGSR